MSDDGQIFPDIYHRGFSTSHHRGREETSKENKEKIEKLLSGNFISGSAKQQIIFSLANDYITSMIKMENFI